MFLYQDFYISVMGSMSHLLETLLSHNIFIVQSTLPASAQCKAYPPPVKEMIMTKSGFRFVAVLAAEQLPHRACYWRS